MQKKLLRFILLLITINVLVYPNKTLASHAAGGELLYEWLYGDTYRIVFKFYRDCTGISEPVNQQLCIFNSCSNTTITTTLEKTILISGGRSNGSPVDYGCPDYKNKCENTSSNIPGYREWWYEDTITLGSKCSLWKFSVMVNTRNGSNNIGSGDFYVEATLNNLVYNNSSPVFTTKPVPYVCLNTPYIYNNGAVDKNQDSLVFETVMPLHSFTCNMAPTVINYLAKLPPLNLTSNPFQTNNSYTINGRTGNITFTPTEAGPQTTTLKVSEYKNGMMVGSTMRDIQVQVMTCQNTVSPPGIKLDTAGISNASLINGVIEACYNKQMSFCFNISSADTVAVLAVSDNHDVATQGASIVYTNNGTDQVTGCFTWTPALSDAGLKILTITVKDSTCRPPGIAIAQTFTVPININTSAPPPTIISPIDACQYSPLPILNITGTNLMWYNVPSGGTGTSTPPSGITATTGKHTIYVSQTPNGCESPRLPVVVNVFSSPRVELLVPKDTICAYEEIIVQDTVANKDTVDYLWHIDSAQIKYTTDAWLISAVFSKTGWNKIVVLAANNICTTTDTADIYVKPSPRSFFHVFKNVCVTTPVILEPVKTDAKYSWQIDGFTINDTVYRPMFTANWPTTGKRFISLTLTGSNGCANTYIDSVQVHPQPIAEIQQNNNYICRDREFTLKATQGQRYKYSWYPPQQFLTNGESTVSGIAEKTGYVYLDVTNEWNCTSTDSLYINGEPCCKIVLPAAFTPDGNGLNDIFKPVNPANKTLLEFIIVNRRGQTVFKGKDINQGWDGTHRNELAGQDTYNYYIRYLCEGNEEFTQKGTVILLR